MRWGNWAPTLACPDLAARAGVVTGEVAVTLGAVTEGMVAGDAVNTAARVQSAAAPGSVLVDAATQRLAGSAVGFADDGSHRLKGKAEPQRLWRVTRVLAGVGGVQRIDGLEAPLIGRDAELRTVKELFHAAAERKVPRLVLVSGAAGVGKSRLGWEFEKYVDGLVKQVWWHRGRCLAYGEGVAFWALAEIVRQRLGIAEEDPRKRPRASWPPAWSDSFPILMSVTMWVCGLAGCWASPSWGAAAASLAREELFAGWRLFFERLAESNRWCCWLRTHITLTPGCWTSWITSSTGPATFLSTCWCSPVRSSARPGRGSAPAATAPR